jgi:nucleoside diphosphate kinase
MPDADQLAYVLVNPYTLAKSRTGGVIGRFISRTGLDIVGARMFAPSKELVENFITVIKKHNGEDEASQKLLVDYVARNYTSEPLKGIPRRVMMILLRGENAIEKVREAAGPVIMGGGETIRDTFGDYVVGEDRRVLYFEPAFLVPSTLQEARDTLKLWQEYADRDGGVVLQALGNEPATLRNWQKTLVLLKPDNFRFPNSRPGNIIDLLSRSGLKIIAAKIHRMSVKEAEEFYAPVKNALKSKLKEQVLDRAARALSSEFHFDVPLSMLSNFSGELASFVAEDQFNQIVKFMTGYIPAECPPEQRDKEGKNKCLALVYAGANAVEKIRKLLGPTDPNKAQPGSVRREFGHDIMVNAAHASDSPQNAEREITIIKPEANNIKTLIQKFYS